MIRSIRAKLTCWYIGSLGLLLLIFSIMAFLGIRTSLLNNIDVMLQNNTGILDVELFEDEFIWPYALRSQFDGGFHAYLDEEIRELFTNVVVYAQILTFPKNNESTPVILAKSYTLKEKSLPIPQQIKSPVQKGAFTIETVEGIFEFPIRLMTKQAVDIDGTPYILQFAIPLQDFVRTLRNFVFVLSILFPVLLLIASGLGYVFMKKAFAPIHQIVTLAKSISAEDLSHRIESVASKDEIGELVETLNAMIARLEQSFKQIQQFSGDVSHELKTPLTAIKGEIEVTLRKERNNEEYKTLLLSLLEETNKLEKIIEDLLFLSRMDAKSIPLAFFEGPLDEILLEVYEELYRLAEHKHIHLALASVDTVKIRAEFGLLKRLLVNLLLNAIKYTPQDGKITLSLQQKENTAILTVSDTGAGIPEASLPYIFDRFYRVDLSRSQETGGSGLGLAIAQKIVEVHHGKIHVSSVAGKGTTFQINLPLHP